MEKTISGAEDKKTDPGSKTRRKKGRSAKEVKSLDFILVQPNKGVLTTIAVTVTIAICIGSVFFAVVRSACFRRLSAPTRYSMSGADIWVLREFPGKPGYFIDIGAFGSSRWPGNSNSRLLEERGWQGVCVDPVPTGFEDRECGTVPRPIAAKTGDIVSFSGCSDGSCSESKTSALGISYLLYLIEAPKVIDYLSISARKAALPILKNFPWSNHCVKAWTIEHENQDEVTTAIKVILAGQGCSLAQNTFDIFARCDCAGLSATIPTLAMQTFSRAARRLPGVAWKGSEPLD